MAKAGRMAVLRSLRTSDRFGGGGVPRRHPLFLNWTVTPKHDIAVHKARHGTPTNITDEPKTDAYNPNYSPASLFSLFAIWTRLRRCTS